MLSLANSSNAGAVPSCLHWQTIESQTQAVEETCRVPTVHLWRCPNAGRRRSPLENPGRCAAASRESTGNVGKSSGDVENSGALNCCCGCSQHYSCERPQVGQSDAGQRGQIDSDLPSAGDDQRPRPPAAPEMRALLSNCRAARQRRDSATSGLLWPGRRNLLRFAMQDDEQTHTGDRELKPRQDFFRSRSLKVDSYSCFELAVPNSSTARIRVCTMAVAV